jgi:hypothetical protein
MSLVLKQKEAQNRFKIEGGTWQQKEPLLRKILTV